MVAFIKVYIEMNKHGKAVTAIERNRKILYV